MSNESIQLRDNDVLCGRGTKGVSHVGNLNYRELVDHCISLYAKSPRSHKTVVAITINKAVMTLDPPGRFIKRIDETDTWCVLSEKEATNKTNRALREKRIKQEIKPYPENNQEYSKFLSNQMSCSRLNTLSYGPSSKFDSFETNEVKSITLYKKRVNEPAYYVKPFKKELDEQLEVNMYDEISRKKPRLSPNLVLSNTSILDFRKYGTLNDLEPIQIHQFSHNLPLLQEEIQTLIYEVLT